MTKTEELIAYATENYEAGGHWIVECWIQADYEDLLNKLGGDVAKAKGFWNGKAMEWTMP